MGQLSMLHCHVLWAALRDDPMSERHRAGTINVCCVFTVLPLTALGRPSKHLTLDA